jgi:PKD repeat protein
MNDAFHTRVFAMSKRQLVRLPGGCRRPASCIAPYLAAGLGIAMPVMNGPALGADVTLAWDAVDDDRVAYYELHWGSASGSYESQQQSTITSTQVTGLADGATYYFAVRACADGGGLCSELSNEVATTTPGPAPKAQFDVSAPTGIAPHTVTFTDASTGSIDSHAWRFGDGVSSTVPSPTHHYDAPGSYDVTLTVSGPDGSDALTQVGAVSVGHPPPTARFTESTTAGLKPLTVTFTSRSEGTIDTHAWDFGDGGSSTAAEAVYTYTGKGTYSVSLTATGPGGEHTLTKPDLITVRPPPPVAGFFGDPVGGEAPLTVSFSSTASGDIDDHHWDFGDGGGSTAVHPSHTFADAGDYTVALTVSGDGGADTHEKIDYVRVAAARLPFASGEITLDAEWARFDFERELQHPVVIVKPMSAGDDTPAVVRIRNVDPLGFEARIQAWDYLPTPHGAPEQCAYLVVERGRHRLADGSLIEAGTLPLSSADGYARSTFAEGFTAVPVVLSGIMSSTDPGAVTTRLRNLEQTGFEIRLQTEEASKRPHGEETVGYIAREPSVSELDGLYLETGRTFEEVTDVPYRIAFTAGFHEPPAMIADMQTTNGGDPANLRWRGKDALSVELWVDEETSKDSETRHRGGGGEGVGYVLIGPARQ